MLGSLAGVCLMINEDYEAFLSDKSFYKKVTKLQETKFADSKVTIAKKSFYGNGNIPPAFAQSIKAYQNFEIEVKEYGQEYAQHLRVLQKYTKTDFFDSLSPSANGEKLALFFENSLDKTEFPEFVTSNRRFIVKQISRQTKNSLLKNFLIPYCKHIMQNVSFISQLLGLFSIRVK